MAEAPCKHMGMDYKVLIIRHYYVNPCFNTGHSWYFDIGIECLDAVPVNFPRCLCSHIRAVDNVPALML